MLGPLTGNLGPLGVKRGGALTAYTLTLQPDGANGVDCMAVQAGPANNYGTTTTFNASGVAGSAQKGLIRYPGLSVIPVSALVSSAILRLRCESESNATDIGVAVHRALTEWFEGGKAGTAPDAGENASTWNLRNANGSVAWAGGAGGGAGSDYATTATDSETITGAGVDFEWDVTADVQAFVNGTATNWGWWLVATGNSLKRFASSDNATAANRPELVIDYLA